MQTNFSDRIRFNWGFHDATHDKSMGRNRQLIPEGELFCLPDDSAYCAGYDAGQRETLATGRPESSQPAWICHQADMIAAKADSFHS